MKKDNTNFVTIGCPGVTIKGSIDASVDVTIGCVLEGDVTSSANVTLSEGAEISGNVTAKDLVIKGATVKGKIVADRLTLMKDSHVGTLTAKVAEVDAGAIIQGTCYIGDTASREGEV